MRSNDESKFACLDSFRTADMTHVFVYQEWDMMRERGQVPEDRVEKVAPAPIRTNNFSIQLQEARIRHRMTVADLAEKCKVTSRQMSLYENGTETPPPEIHKRIVELLKIE